MSPVPPFPAPQLTANRRRPTAPAPPSPPAAPRPPTAPKRYAPPKPSAVPSPPVAPTALKPVAPIALKPVAPTALEIVAHNIVACNRCPRLRAYCTAIGETRRLAYRDQVYWARPVPGFGSPRARILILGLAPGAHGANRTGRPFTGDGSGNFMYPILHNLGLASKPVAVSRDDGLRLRDCFISSVLRCAPPGDKPLPEELRNCAPHLTAQIAALPRLRVIVCLGKIAWDGYLAHLLAHGVIERRSAYRFTHGAEYTLPNGLTLLGSYHPSLRNTLTGRLNATMFTRIFLRALDLLTP